ncbi:MAG: glycosyltransferase family 2 protein [Peptococcia bacterium]|jgi:glycosyltransferase involved in cell wall biosynthesis
MSVTTIIPAYNEGKYISNVLKSLQNVEEITQIIVVSDGSTDNTVQEALNWGAQVIALQENIGKGGALNIGLQYSLEDIVLFLDADLLGLTEQHILDLISPVINGQAEMTVGIFENGRLVTDMAQVLSPYLSGQRCIKKRCLEQIEDLAISGFGAETVLTHYAQQKKLQTVYVQLPKMSHVMKEEKLGLVKGFAYRMKMYWEIAKKVRMGG